MATTQMPMGFGTPNSIKMFAHWVDLLGQLLSQNCVSEICRPDQTPSLCQKSGGPKHFFELAYNDMVDFVVEIS